MYGVDTPLAFLRKHLLQRNHHVPRPWNELLLPQSKTLLLFGRRGSGKNTLLNMEDEDGGDVFLRHGNDDCPFHIVLDWKMRPWNYEDFPRWVAHVISVLDNGSMDSVLIVLQGIHQLNYLRGGNPVLEMIHLLTAVRASHRDVRLVMTCDEKPSQFPQEMQSLIDAQCFMPMMGPADRIAFMRDLMADFYSLCQWDETLKNVQFTIDLSPDAAQKDPDHILNMLAMYSAETTPREMLSFMQRTFAACSTPTADGHTEYNADLIEKLTYKVEGATYITPDNPLAKNEPFYKYIKLDPELSAANTNMCYLNGDKPAFEGNRRVTALAAEQEADAKRKAKKRVRKDGADDKDKQPAQMQDVIKERVAQQNKLLENRTKRLREESGQEEEEEEEKQ